jgi:hypothetical protein
MAYGHVVERAKQIIQIDLWENRVQPDAEVRNNSFK